MLRDSGSWRKKNDSWGLDRLDLQDGFLATQETWDAEVIEGMARKRKGQRA